MCSGNNQTLSFGSYFPDKSECCLKHDNADRCWFNYCLCDLHFCFTTSATPDVFLVETEKYGNELKCRIARNGPKGSVSRAGSFPVIYLDSSSIFRKTFTVRHAKES